MSIWKDFSFCTTWTGMALLQQCFESSCTVFPVSSSMQVLPSYFRAAIVCCWPNPKSSKMLSKKANWRLRHFVLHLSMLDSTAENSSSCNVLAAGSPCLSLFNDARLNGQVRAIFRPLIGQFCWLINSFALITHPRKYTWDPLPSSDSPCFRLSSRQHGVQNTSRATNRSSGRQRSSQADTRDGQ